MLKSKKIASILNYFRKTKVLGRDLIMSLNKNVQSRMVELLNKILDERQKIKYKEYMEYLLKNPKKKRRRFANIFQGNNLSSQRKTSEIFINIHLL